MALHRGEIQLLERLIDLRESADLAGLQEAVFQLSDYSGEVVLVVPPGASVMSEMSARGITRLRSAGLIEMITPNSFDLVADVRDRLDVLKTEAGKPTLLGQVQADLARATGRVAELEGQAKRAAELRRKRREALAAAWGARVRRLVRGIAIVVYLAAVAAPLALGLPVLVTGTLLVIGAVLQVSDWAFGRDGNGVATSAGRIVEHWILSSLESVSEAGA